MRQLKLPNSTRLYTMDDDSVTFGSPAAGATPGSNPILAQPPLEAEASPVASGQGGDEALEGIRIYLNIFAGIANLIKALI